MTAAEFLQRVDDQQQLLVTRADVTLPVKAVAADVLREMQAHLQHANDDEAVDAAWAVLRRAYQRSLGEPPSTHPTATTYLLHELYCVLKGFPKP